MARKVELGEEMKIENFSLRKIDNSLYIKPYRINFSQNGNVRKWDCIKAHDSIGVFLYNITTKQIIVVKQFRPAVYTRMLLPKLKAELGVTPDKLTDTPTDIPQANLIAPQLGITWEMCAGIVDKDVPLNKIAQAEVWEECGYKVPLEKIQKINSFLSSLGASGSKQDFFYAEVTNEMRVGKGGGLTEENEEIEVVHLSLDEAKSLYFDENRPKSCGLCLGICWFFHKNGLQL